MDAGIINAGQAQLCFDTAAAPERVLRRVDRPDDSETACMLHATARRLFGVPMRHLHLKDSALLARDEA